MSDGGMLPEILTAASRMAEFCYSDPRTWDKFTDWMFENDYYEPSGALNPDSNGDFYGRVPGFIARLAEFAGSFPGSGE